MLDFLLNDPVGHWVDVKSRSITAEPVGFYERRAATHEGIANFQPLEAVCRIKRLLKGFIEKFGKQQTAEQCAGSSGKPLVNRNNRPIILLNLFFAQGKVGYERDVEIFFYQAREPFIAGCFT